MTIQPRGATGPSRSDTSAQSAAQFAGTVVAGTLKALGSVADTVTSFVTGKDSATTAVYTPDRDNEQVHFVYVGQGQGATVSIYKYLLKNTSYV